MNIESRCKVCLARRCRRYINLVKRQWKIMEKLRLNKKLSKFNKRVFVNMSVIALKCKKCLARQRLMKFIKLNKLNKLLKNKQINL